MYCHFNTVFRLVDKEINDLIKDHKFGTFAAEQAKENQNRLLSHVSRFIKAVRESHVKKWFKLGMHLVPVS